MDTYEERIWMEFGPCEHDSHAAVMAVLREAVAAEREACAKIVEKLASADVVYPEGIRMIADAIRNRT